MNNHHQKPHRGRRAGGWRGMLGVCLVAMAIGLWAAHPVLHFHAGTHDPNRECPLHLIGANPTPTPGTPAPVVMAPQAVWAAPSLEAAMPKLAAARRA